jgi:uncharacterized protein DUF4124
MRMLLVLAGLTVSLAAASQEIYRWVDKDGIVHYADQPGSSDAKLINVIEPSTYEAPDTSSYSSTSGGDDSGSPPANPRYTGLTLVSPAAEETFFGADAVVTATAELEGEMPPDHSLVFFLNGERHPAEGMSVQFAGLARGSYFLVASVLNQAGKPVISSPQITFHVRQPSILSPQSPQAPKPPPKPTPKPTPKPLTPRRM